MVEDGIMRDCDVIYLEYRFFFEAVSSIRGLVLSIGLGDEYKRQVVQRY